MALYNSLRAYSGSRSVPSLPNPSLGLSHDQRDETQIQVRLNISFRLLAVRRHDNGGT